MHFILPFGEVLGNSLKSLLLYNVPQIFPLPDFFLFQTIHLLLHLFSYLFLTFCLYLSFFPDLCEHKMQSNLSTDKLLVMSLPGSIFFWRADVNNFVSPTPTPNTNLFLFSRLLYLNRASSSPFAFRRQWENPCWNVGYSKTKWAATNTRVSC